MNEQQPGHPEAQAQECDGRVVPVVFPGRDTHLLRLLDYNQIGHRTEICWAKLLERPARRTGASAQG
jgi:hypothetical protein